MSLVRPTADGKFSINGTYKYQGSLKDLRDILNKAIDELGPDANCYLSEFNYKGSWNAYVRVDSPTQEIKRKK